MSSIAGNRVKVEKYIGKIDGVILSLSVLYGLFSQYFFLCVLSGIALVVILKRLWKPYVPPVLVFFLTFHWVQVFFSIVYVDFLGLTIDKAFDSNDTETLFAFTFLQLIVMAIVLSSFLHKIKLPGLSKQTLVDAAKKLNTNNIIICYIASGIVLPVILSVSYSSPSLVQLIRSFFAIKTLFAGLLFFTLFLKKTENKWLIILLLVVDFLLSFASFFSDFKEYIFMVAIGYLTLYPKLKASTVMKILPAGILLFVFLSFWSFVKGDYREYLNQGSGAQVVRVSNTDALKYIFSQFTDFNTDALRLGGEKLLSRIQYMERYSEVYNRVPRVIEHRDGQNLEATLKFILVPRFIDPDKGIKDASSHTSYYTGKAFRSAAQGTSISMGYFCDLYIDYGLYFMFLPLIIFAAIIGYFVQYILSQRKYNILFSYSLLIGVFLSFGTFESDMNFFLGMMRNNIAFLIVGYAAIFMPIHKFITRK